MSVRSVGATAQPSDAAVNTASAASSVGRRPKRSPMLPYSGAATVAASKYATTTQEKSANPPSEDTIAGSALARIVWSTAARNMANMTPGNTRRNAARRSTAGEGGAPTG